MTTTTATKKAAKKAAKVTVSTLAKSVAGRQWTAAKAAAVEAFGTGRQARLSVGSIIANAEASHLLYASSVAVKERNADGQKASDTAAGIADAMSAVYGDAAWTRQECFNMKRHYQVLAVLASKGIGTQAQRDTFSEGAARSVPKAMTIAKQELLLNKAAKAAGTGRITATLIDAAKPAKKEGKPSKKASKAVPKVQPADVVSFLGNAAKNGTDGKVTDSMKADLEAAFRTYMDSL